MQRLSTGCPRSRRTLTAARGLDLRRFAVFGTEEGCHLECPCSRPAFASLPAGISRRRRRWWCRWRWRQTDRSLSSPDQCLLAGTLTPEPLALLPQRRQLRGAFATPTASRFAPSQKTGQGPRLQLVISRQRDAQHLGSLRWATHAGQDFKDRRGKTFRLRTAFQ